MQGLIPEKLLCKNKKSQSGGNDILEVGAGFLMAQ